MKKLLPLTLALPLALIGSIQAAVLLSDDFSSSTSGFGWAAADPWESFNGQAVTVGTGFMQQSFRAFATPFNASGFDKLYIAFDFTQAGNGQAWGGASLFTSAAGGDEPIFIGDPDSPFSTTSGDPSYGIVGGGNPVVNSNVAISGSTVRLIAELDFNASGTQSTYRLWVNSTDIDNATASATGGSPIGTVSSIRLASDSNNGPVTYDNLVVGTSPADVGLAAVPEPTSIALIGIAGAMLGLRRRRS